MSTGVDWLQKQKKATLVEIAEHTNMSPGYEKQNKSDLTNSVENHLRLNASSYQNDALAAPFYQGVDPASPVKHQAGKAVAGGVKAEEVTAKKPRQRRQTIKAKEDIEGEPSTASTSALVRTPARALSTASRKASTAVSASSIPLPASPAVIANQIDAATSGLLTSFSTRVSASRFPGYITSTRRALSSPPTLSFLLLFLEAWSLRPLVLPLKSLAEIPPIPALGTDAIAVKVPDFFACLTWQFWGPVAVWSFVSLLGPLLAGYFVNIRGATTPVAAVAGKEEEGKIDVLSFHVCKAVLAWVVFLRGGLGRGESVRVVEMGIPGGVGGLFVGAAVGGIAGLWEGVVRK